MKRHQVLLAYDIGQRRQQAQVRKHIRQQASSHQLSAYECALNSLEKDALLADITHFITEDAALLACKLDNRRTTYYLGQGQPPPDANLFLID